MRLHLCLTLLLILGWGGAEAASLLPHSLPGMQSLDVGLNRGGERGPADVQADRNGIGCQDFRLFVYSDAAQASEAVGAWLASRNLHPEQVYSEAGQRSEWRAGTGSGQVYGFWQADDVDSPSGRLYLCSGTAFDVKARDARRAEASRQLDTINKGLEEQTHRRSDGVRLPFWAVIALGSLMAGGISKGMVGSVWK